MSQSNYYVYLHIRKSDGIIFYVGMGINYRAWQKGKTERNDHWHKTVLKHGYTITLVYENLTKEDALSKEIELIKSYRNISGDKLVNMTEGGEGGMQGHKHTLESRAKMSLSQKQQSDEIRAKRSVAAKNRTDGHFEKLKEINKNRSKEHQDKINASHTGKKQSDATKSKRAASLTGTKRTEEQKERMRLAKSNMSQETIAKMRIAAALREENKRQKKLLTTLTNCGTLQT